MATKEEWPELVGKSGEEAKEAILKERPELTVEVLGENSPCTKDYRIERVRVFVNEEGKVAGTPRTG